MMEYILAMLTQHCAVKGTVDKNKLAAAIVWQSAQAEVDPELVTRIILTESRCKPGVVNKQTHDYGLMQINDKTAQAIGADMKCLMNWPCNLKQGVRILSGMDRVCRYNVGTGKLHGKRLQNCLTYERKLDTFILAKED